MTTVKFQEEYIAKLPALTLLINLGWSFLMRVPPLKREVLL